MGLFGDTMQRIYSDGKPDLGDGLPGNWLKPAKAINHRSPRRIIGLINKIRAEVDTHQQEPRDGAPEGVVRFFIIAGEGANRAECEDRVRRRMAELTQDEKWTLVREVKLLTLEHHMAAQRLGFADIFSALDSVRDFRTGLRDGSLPLIAFFSNLVLPLVTAKNAGNNFATAAIVREHSPLLSADTLASPGVDQGAQLKAARDGVCALAALFAGGAQPTLHEVLTAVAQSRLFRIPQGLLPFTTGVTGVARGVNEESPAEDMAGSKTLEAIRQYLQAPFAQIERYAEYIRGESQIATHQGVKGLEFPRVLVVMDDAEAGGFLFSFEKLFGAKSLTATDLKNEREGNETGVDRTRRLFYVTCSRAKDSLALVAYSAAPVAVRKTLTEQGWFDPAEIELLE